MTREEVFEQLKQIISSEGFLEEEITMNADLRVDLGMDSLDVVEMTIGIEERFFDCETIDEEVAERWKTVGDIVEYLVKQPEIKRRKSNAS